MTHNLKWLAAATLLATAPAFAADCSLSDAPEVPDGASATLEEMVAGQQAVKTFQADAQAYRACMDGEMAAIKAAAEADEVDEEAAARFKAATEAYNASVAAEEALAEDFNAEIRAYKEANPS